MHLGDDAVVSAVKMLAEGNLFSIEFRNILTGAEETSGAGQNETAYRIVLLSGLQDRNQLLDHRLVKGIRFGTIQ